MSLDGWKTLIKNAKLQRQIYGIAMCQGTFGGPKGIWLECTECPESEVIVGSGPDTSPWVHAPMEACAEVFKNHGWTGKGKNLTHAKCPKCSKSKGEKAS